jgi:serpin B
MKRYKYIVRILLLTGLLTACGGNNEVVEIPETQKEQQEPKKETSTPEKPDIPDEDSMVVDMLPQTRAILLTPEQRAFAQKNNDFTFNLYRTIHQMQKVKKSNITSPLSVTYVLGMLNDGAKGETAEEITKVLGFGGGDKKALNEYCQALITQAPIADPSVTLEMANIVAANKDVILESAFEQDVKTFYSAEAISLDFSQLSSLDYINGWCNEKSHGMIPKIIDNLSPDAMLVLMNAIYFKATWTDKFDKKDTKDETFTKADGSSVTLPMMHRKAEIQCGQNDLFTSIRLPYGSGDNYSMYILLPAEGKTVDDIIVSLNNEFWEANRNSAIAIADIKLPRFETKSEIELNEMVKELGASSMFDPKKADFTGISRNYKELYVSLLKQKAAIEVNEEGTKTSAVTIAMMDGEGGGPNKTIDFHANRPFVYLIQEWDTQAIFFIGTFQGD